MRMLVLLVIFASATSASAQELAVGISESRDFWRNDPNLNLPESLNVAVAVPLSDRFALEPFASRGWVRQPYGREAQGLYGAQIRQRIARFSRPGTMVFVAYGVGGYYDGRAVRPPVATFITAGFRHSLFGAIAVRPEVQLVNLFVLPTTLRAVVGVSIDFRRLSP